jgi:hypothetical protein
MTKPTASADAPPFVVICGPAGSGKTVDILRAVGASAVVAAAEGALKPIEPVLGNAADLIMAEIRCSTIEEGTKALTNLRRSLANGYRGKKPQWFVADEFSYMAARTAAALERRLKGFKFHAVLKQTVMDFRDAARSAGIGVICNCWDQPPKTTSSGKFVRGGPRLPSDLPEQFPGIADYVFLAKHDIAQVPWPWAYRTIGDQNWALKNRDHNTPPMAPMNLGVILRDAGYACPYPPAMERIRTNIEYATSAFLQPGINVGALCEEFYALLLGAGIDPRVAKWAVTDARDAAVLQAARTNRWSTFAAF